MKKSLVKIAMASALAVSIIPAANAAEVSPAELTKIKGEYPELLGRPGVTIVKSQDLGNVKQLKVSIQTPRGPQEFETFVVKGSDIIFAGTAFDKTGKKVSFPVDAALVKAGVAFSVGTGPEQLYLVTDPECPYCRRLDQNLDKSVYTKYTFNVIPFPLSFHKDAKPMYRYILSGKDNAEKAKRYEAVMAGGNEWSKVKLTPEEIAAADKLMASGEASAKELQARGTPSVYDSEFSQFNYGPLLKKK